MKRIYPAPDVGPEPTQADIGGQVERVRSMDAIAASRMKRTIKEQFR